MGSKKHHKNVVEPQYIMLRGNTVVEEEVNFWDVVRDSQRLNELLYEAAALYGDYPENEDGIWIDDLDVLQARIIEDLAAYHDLRSS